MLHIRITKSKGKYQYVQVYRYEEGKRVIVKHIGSGTTQEEIKSLIEMAKVFINDISKQTYLFEEGKPQEDSVLLSQCEFIGVYYRYFYEVIRAIQHHIGYGFSIDPLLNDLVVMRIFEPCSKLRSIELLEHYFGIKHRRQRYYEAAKHWLELKEKIEKQTVHFARKHYNFDFSLVFYDVTTLYFETFAEDDFRKYGFSKDNKHHQPQIVVALMVTREGFPLGYELFSGNTFEGHTLIPAIKSFINKHHIKHFTVVADAAMISSTNIRALKAEKINYIVGARLGNLSSDVINKIDKLLNREDGSIIRLNTDNGYLVCGYSKSRYRKDKYEMNKQIEKAKMMLQNPSKIKRVKFISAHEHKMELNEKLIEKTTKLLGIKGYYTDLDESVVSSKDIISRYHELYKIEQAFRISKSDLQTRPIFHFKNEPIKLHVLICFMALAISKHIEIKTSLSIRAFTDKCKRITDGRVVNKINGKEVILKANVPKDFSNIVADIISPH